MFDTPLTTLSMLLSAPDPRKPKPHSWLLLRGVMALTLMSQTLLIPWTTLVIWILDTETTLHPSSTRHLMPILETETLREMDEQQTPRFGRTATTPLPLLNRSPIMLCLSMILALLALPHTPMPNEALMIPIIIAPAPMKNGRLSLEVMLKKVLLLSPIAWLRGSNAPLQSRADFRVS